MPKQQVSSESHLEIGHRWSDQHHPDYFKKFYLFLVGG